MLPKFELFDLFEFCLKGFGGCFLSGRGVFVSLGMRQNAPFVRTARLLRKLLDTVLPIPNVKHRIDAGFSKFENGHGFFFRVYHEFGAVNIYMHLFNVGTSFKSENTIKTMQIRQFRQI